MFRGVLVLAAATVALVVVPVAVALTLNDIHSYRRPTSISDDDDPDGSGDTLRQALNAIQRRRRMFDVGNRARMPLPGLSSFSQRRPSPPSKRQIEEVGDLPYLPDSNDGEDFLVPLVGSASSPTYSAVISGKLSKLLRQMENQVQEKRTGSKMQESREDHEERVTAVVDGKPGHDDDPKTVDPKKQRVEEDGDKTGGSGTMARKTKRQDDETGELRPSPALTKIMPFASLYPDRTTKRKRKSPVGKRSSVSEGGAVDKEDVGGANEVAESDDGDSTPGTRYFRQLYADKKEVLEIRRPENESAVEDFLRKVQELPPTEYFNYASGLEHHSRFWDPSYDAMGVPAGYGEDVERRKRKRKSGRRVLKDEDYPRDSDDSEEGFQDGPKSHEEEDGEQQRLRSRRARRRKSPGFEPEERTTKTEDGDGRKRGGRALSSIVVQDEQRVLGELKDILKDDDREEEDGADARKRSVKKKRENPATSARNATSADTLQRPNHSEPQPTRDAGETPFRHEDDDTEDAVADNDPEDEEGDNRFSAPLESAGKSSSPSKNRWGSDKKHFDEWLRQEYYRNLARSMINMRRRRRKRSDGGEEADAAVDRRKRSSFGHWGDLRVPTDEEETEGGGGRETTRSRQYRDVYDKLKNIEDALILEALEIVKEEARTGTRSEAERRKLSNRLDAAYDLESMRLALEDLQDTMDKMEKEPDAASGYGDLARASSSEGNELRRYFEDDGYAEKRRGSKRTTEPGSGNPPVMISIPMDELNELESELSEGEECPALELLTSDCSALADVVPDARLQKLFLQACNWHEVCYSCGEAFGLTSSDCDIGFLAQSHTVCQQDAPCETTARLLLSPLRQRRVFYKRSIPDVCYRYSCVRQFLHLR